MLQNSRKFAVNAIVKWRRECVTDTADPASVDHLSVRQVVLSEHYLQVRARTLFVQSFYCLPYTFDIHFDGKYLYENVNIYPATGCASSEAI